MRRRAFIAGLGFTAVWPRRVARGTDKLDRRIAVLIGFSNDTGEAASALKAFLRECAALGWTKVGMPD